MQGLDSKEALHLDGRAIVAKHDTETIRCAMYSDRDQHQCGSFSQVHSSRLLTAPRADVANAPAYHPLSFLLPDVPAVKCRLVKAGSGWRTKPVHTQLVAIPLQLPNCLNWVAAVQRELDVGGRQHRDCTCVSSGYLFRSRAILWAPFPVTNHRAAST